MKQKGLNLLLICLSLVFVDRFCRNQTKGFRISKASTDHVYPFQSHSQEIPPCLNQPFYFLGGGVQCYAFVGKDQKTVLKLFKHHHMGLSTDQIKKTLPQGLASSILEKRERRMVRLFKSAQIAHELLSEETAVFYTHLSKTDDMLGTTLVYDPLGASHPLDLDKTEFILQTKVDTVEERLDHLFREERIDEAIESMNTLLSMIERRSKKGIKNKDGKITINCGFKKEQPIEIDIGSYVFRSVSTNPDPHQSARMKGTMQLLRWIKGNYPEHLHTCKRRLLDENLL